MHGLLKRPGYRLYPPDSPEAGALLTEQGLCPADLHQALARLERAEGTTVRSSPASARSRSAGRRPCSASRAPASGLADG